MPLITLDNSNHIRYSYLFTHSKTNITTLVSKRQVKNKEKNYNLEGGNYEKLIKGCWLRGVPKT